MARKEIKTSIEIKATSSKIWQILIDFENYPNWNPFIKSISGKLKEGGKLNINAGDMKFKPQLKVVKPKKQIVWLGKLLFRGIFDGEHRFTIIENTSGSCTFLHEESFNGLLVGIFKKKLDETKEGFNNMNLKLKELAEENNQQ